MKKILSFLISALRSIWNSFLSMTDRGPQLDKNYAFFLNGEYYECSKLEILFQLVHGDDKQYRTVLFKSARNEYLKIVFMNFTSNEQEIISTEEAIVFLKNYLMTDKVKVLTLLKEEFQIAA